MMPAWYHCFDLQQVSIGSIFAPFHRLANCQFKKENVLTCFPNNVFLNLGLCEGEIVFNSLKLIRVFFSRTREVNDTVGILSR